MPSVQPHAGPTLDKVSLLDRLVEAIFPAFLPRWLCKLILLKILKELVVVGLMGKDRAAAVRKTSVTLPAGPVTAGVVHMPAKIEARSVPETTRKTLHKLLDIAFPHEKSPTKKDLDALLGLAERSGVGERDVIAYLATTLDTTTLQSLSIQPDFETV